MERNIWLYWDKGFEHIPPLLKKIYEHNVNICERYGWKTHLLTLENVKDYLPSIEERFFKITLPQSQFANIF